MANNVIDFIEVFLCRYYEQIVLIVRGEKNSYLLFNWLVRTTLNEHQQPQQLNTKNTNK